MSSSSGVRRVIPLTFGWQHLPKSVSVRGADPSIRMREPVPGILCEITFAAAGIDLADVVGVGLSHLHYDHAGGVRFFAGRAPVFLQRRELDVGLAEGEGLAHSAFQRCFIKLRGMSG